MGDENIASMSVKYKIKQIIDGENQKRPFSDQAIVDQLKKENIDIARRTVAKYRESMGIMSSSKRRQII
jgi:RNA polymerase sigma-54 factor